MAFNSAVFLFLFLPIFLILYFVASRPFKNIIALAGSLVFYCWGQAIYLPLILVLMLVNYYLAQNIKLDRNQPSSARLVMIAGIIINLFVLLFFKLITAYGADWLSFFLPSATIETLASKSLPLGISYITFQLISYQVDIYNELVDSEKNLLNFAMYVLLFPKIIVGPITRYRDIVSQITDRQIQPDEVAAGARRLILGLAKKILIADTLARVVNPAFALPTPNFDTGTAWLVLVGYTIQLYFDFSGYVDMALGLAQMLGFRLVENFDYPYVSKNISEFWRRWHISLSSWFRDYVFYPLEFTRRRADRWRQSMHVVIVFMLTGLWHGLTINFLLWGLIHGLAIALEMSGFGRFLKKLWTPFQHAYALIVILIGWVFFRSSDLAYALAYFGRLAGWRGGITPLPFSITQPLPMIDTSVWVALALGIVFSLPVLPRMKKYWQSLSSRSKELALVGRISADIFLIFLLLVSIAFMIGYRYVTNIYGNF